MHIAARLEFSSAKDLTLPELQSLFAAQVENEPLLCCRLVAGRWEPATDFAIERHVRQTSEDADHVLAAPLDRKRPLWEVWLAPRQGAGEGFALLIKIHHALIDGVGGIALLDRLLRPAPQHAPRSPTRSITQASPARKRPRKRTLGERGRELISALRLVREHFRSFPPNPLNGEVGPHRRHIGFTIDAARFDAVARSLGGTRNDLLLATCTGALRRFLAEEATPTPAALRAFCPVNLRPRGGAKGFGNRIAPWLVSLPIARVDLRARLEEIREQTRALRRRRAHHGGDRVARVVEYLGGWVARFGVAIAARRRAFSLVITQVPGPARPLDLLGAPLDRLFAYVPLFPGQRASVAVVNLGGRLCVGIAEAWPDPDRGERFAAAMRAEFEAVSNWTREAQSERVPPSDIR